MQQPVTCTETRRRLGEGPLGACADDVRDHLDNCRSCNEIARGFAALDGLLLAEAAPPAPPGLAGSIRAALAARRAAARRARLATWAGLVGAAAAAVAVAAVGPPTALPAVPSGWLGLGAAALARLEALGAGLSAGAGQALNAAPTPPWIALLVAAPLLAYVNWTLSRGAAVGARP